MEMGPDTLLEPPARKRRRVTMKASRGFKKDFDPPPSSLSNCLPSSHKCPLFKSMVANWWLQGHPDAKTIGGAPWLVGFYDRLHEEDLHMTNSEYLKELLVWHKEKEVAAVSE